MRIMQSEGIGQRPRTFVGAVVLENGEQVVASCLEAVGKGFDARPYLLGTSQVPLPKPLSEKVRAACRSDENGSSRIPIASFELTEPVSQAIRLCIQDVEREPVNAPCLPLAIALCDPGSWSIEGGVVKGVQPIVEASRIAEISGHNIIHHLNARDLAAGGNGGPIDAMAKWLLLHDAKRDRVLLDLGPTTRMIYLPQGYESSAAERVFATDLGPGISFLDSLGKTFRVQEISKQSPEKMALQGRVRPEWIDHWLSAPYFLERPPRWLPQGVDCQWFIHAALTWAREPCFSVEDLFRSATHFLAEMVFRALDSTIPHSHSRIQIVTHGAGERNGLLLQELDKRWTNAERIPLSQVFPEVANLPSACAAALAMLYVDQQPQTRPMISGVETPRMLGSLTPGSPKNWQRLLKAMADASPSTMSLRSAI